MIICEGITKFQRFNEVKEDKQNNHFFINEQSNIVNHLD